MTGEFDYFPLAAVVDRLGSRGGAIMSASIIHLSTRQAHQQGHQQGHQEAAGFGALAIALANVRMACDRCEAVARRIEGGNGADCLPMLSEAMHQVARQAGKVSRVSH